MMNIENYLNQNYDFYFNQVLKKSFFKKKSCENCGHTEITDYALNSILRDLKKQGFNISRSVLRDLLFSDFIKPKNPIQEYFEKLEEWNGNKDYINDLASTLKTKDQKLFEWSFKKWLVAMVACALEKDSINQTIVILIGSQGLGKSRWIEAILPEELRYYFNSDRLNLKDKDTLIQLSENILIILEEVSSFKSSEVDAIKELITKSKIKLRRAYGIYAENFERRASFIGSTNDDEILADVTGNRRFLAFKIDEITYPDFIDLDKVYSQAYSLYKSGFQHWFDKEDIKKINSNNEQYRQISVEEEFLIKYFKPHTKNSDNVLYLSASEVIDEIQKLEKSKILSHLKLGKILNAKGFKSVKKKGLKKYMLVRL